MKFNFKKLFPKYCESFEAYSKMMAAYYKSYVPDDNGKTKK